MRTGYRRSPGVLPDRLLSETKGQLRQIVAVLHSGRSRSTSALYRQAEGPGALFPGTRLWVPKIAEKVRGQVAAQFAREPDLPVRPQSMVKRTHIAEIVKRARLMGRHLVTLFSAPLLALRPHRYRGWSAVAVACQCVDDGRHAGGLRGDAADEGFDDGTAIQQDGPQTMRARLGG